MRYRNEKTGATIEVKSVISGGAWRAVEPASSAESEEPKKKRKAAAKKDE